MSGRGPEPLWRPSAAVVEAARLTDYCRFLQATRGLEFPGYAELWDWSVRELEAFWASLWEYFGVRASRGYDAVLPDRAMPGARWFPGALLSYAEHVFAGKDDAAVALVHASELRPLAETTLGRAPRADRRRRRRAGRPRRRARRPGRRLPPEHRRDGHRLPRLRVARCRLVFLLPRFRRSRRRRPLRADRAEGAARGRRLPLRRARLRPARGDRADPGRAPDARPHGPRALPARAACAPGQPGHGRASSRAPPSFVSSSSRSTTRSGCCTRPARRACRRRSCTVRAGSCSST